MTKIKRKTKTLAEGRKPGSGGKKGNLHGPRSRDSVMLNLFNAGDSFFTEKSDKAMTAIACAYGVKITTERFLAIHPIKHTVIRLTKVIITDTQ